ncbi:MAG: hypothetical protein CVU00_02920 [Bacteroidetes bacterium HGW-Bacteroidetes-17]|jgi:hypothetical protein|nr:MAG: hypothetical protein CVU00_02920 [Bacteroidetes bacterium HGW-Bacteroidetes-17]
MNSDTIQNPFRYSELLQNILVPQQTDSSTIMSDGLFSKSDNTSFIGRFITERDSITYIPTDYSKNMVAEWITYLILGGFILIAILNFLHRKKLVQFFNATFSRSQANLVIREGNPFRKQITLILTLIYLIAVPLLFYSFIVFYLGSDNLIENGIIFYLELALLFLGLFLYKVLFIQFTANIFQTEKPSYELLVNILIFNLIIGLIILPIITLFIFTQLDILLYISLGIYFIGLFLRQFRQFMVGLSRSIFSVLHLFLYLCTLELIPVVIISKIILNYYE